MLPKMKTGALVDSDGQMVDMAAVSDPSLSTGGQSLCSNVRNAAGCLRRDNLMTTRLTLQEASLQMMSFCMSMTREEKSAVHSLRETMGAFTREILGDLVVDYHYSHPLLVKEGRVTIDERQEGYSWAKYGVMGDGHEHDFTFYPEWFLDQHRQKLRFLSAACTSQYFLSFVDNLRLYELHRSRCKALISHWLWRRMRRRGKRDSA